MHAGWERRGHVCTAINNAASVDACGTWTQGTGHPSAPTKRQVAEAAAQAAGPATAAPMAVAAQGVAQASMASTVVVVVVPAGVRMVVAVVGVHMVVAAAVAMHASSAVAQATSRVTAGPERFTSALLMSLEVFLYVSCKMFYRRSPVCTRGQAARAIESAAGQEAAAPCWAHDRRCCSGMAWPGAPLGARVWWPRPGQPAMIGASHPHQISRRCCSISALYIWACQCVLGGLHRLRRMDSTLPPNMWHAPCMQLVPAVTELMVAELLYLEKQGPVLPIEMLINSSGTTRQDGEIVSAAPHACRPEQVNCACATARSAALLTAALAPCFCSSRLTVRELPSPPPWALSRTRYEMEAAIATAATATTQQQQQQQAGSLWSPRLSHHACAHIR